MNPKQLKLVIIVFLLVGGLGLFMVVQDRQAWTAAERSIGGLLISDFPMNDVEGMDIQASDGQVTLAKVDGTWRVADRGNYPADFGKIREVLLNVGKLKVLQHLKVGESQLGRLELKPTDQGDGAGILLTFRKAGGDAVGTLMLGKLHLRQAEASSFGGGEFPDGRYVFAGDDPTQVALVSETFSQVETESAPWLDKSFFKVEKVRAARVQFPDEEASWSVQREEESADMILEGLKEGEILDATKSYGLKNLLSSPSFEDVVAADVTDETLGLDAPTQVALETFEGFTYAVTLGKADEKERYPLRLTVSGEFSESRKPAEGEKEEDKERLDKEFAEKGDVLKKKLAKEQAFAGHTFWVSKWTVDALLKKRAELVKTEEETQEPEASAPVNPLEGGFDALSNPLLNVQ